MNSFGLIALAMIAPLAMAVDGPSGTPPASPVLRSFEPAESVVFRLPGPPVPVPVVRKIAVAPPMPVKSPLPDRLVLDVPPSPAAPKPVLPDGMEQDVAFFCQKQIAHWRESDARQLLGAPLRNRPSYDENQAVSGRIYAFHDPTGRYRELELDFDGKTGTLRTVFVYPPRLTWLEARRRWTGEVNAADARAGRKFYSYAHRRLDVLVDAQGKVISLGLY